MLLDENFQMYGYTIKFKTSHSFLSSTIQANWSPLLEAPANSTPNFGIIIEKLLAAQINCTRSFYVAACCSAMAGTVFYAVAFKLNSFVFFLAKA